MRKAKGMACALLAVTITGGPIHLGSYETTRKAEVFVVASSGNIARYRVHQEIMAPVGRPNRVEKVTGQTQSVSGAIVLDASGAVNQEQSEIVIDLRSLNSNNQLRDKWLHAQLLETDKFPEARLKPSSVRGFDGVSLFGRRSVAVAGVLTLHGHSIPTLWRGRATVLKGAVTGIVRTVIDFRAAGLRRPAVGLVTLHDSIGLEYEFHFVPR